VEALRGGQTTPIWIVNLKTLDLVKVPRDNSNDADPVWVGNQVYFLSDRNGPVSLFRYDLASKQVSQMRPTPATTQVVPGRPGGLVYEQFGSIHLVDTATNADQVLSIRIHGELPNLAPHLASILPNEIQNPGSRPPAPVPSFEAHGEIFTVPAEKGDTRNLTNTPGIAERNPSWSPDGKTSLTF